MIAAVLSAACIPPAVVGGWYFAPMVARRLTERRLRARCASTRSLVLTYDDGPSPAVTPRLLELLGSRRARATFFLLGSRAEDHPELVDAAVAAGHEVGSHSQSHVNAWRARPLRCTKDIAAGYRTLSRWVPADGLFRPPFGKMNLLTWAALGRRGAPIGWWTIDGDDRREQLADPAAACARAERAGGGIILLHDFHRAEERTEFMLRSTELLLDAAERNGWTVRTLGQLLAAGERHAA
jgi:peptidoglycan/xylan/chitin deacetylase (PgdA/CDA1 family)